jgi:hypothetical protein
MEETIKELTAGIQSALNVFSPENKAAILLKVADELIDIAYDFLLDDIR